MMATFNFRRFPQLTLTERNQLGGVQDSLTDDAHQKRTALINRLILPNRYDPVRGLYFPLSQVSNQYRRIPKSFLGLPAEVLPRSGTNLLYFGNALLLPEGRVDDNFDLELALAPKLRVTNSGILIVTHEYDPKTVEQFQEILGWTRSAGKFALLDRVLCQFRDYRGYSVVFSGNKSLHFHYIFNTEHLEHVPFDAARTFRDTHREVHCSIMANVHELYWDRLKELIVEILNPSFESDGDLRRVTQWKRLPWGNRYHATEGKLFNIAAGTTVAQLVVNERIRNRAAKGYQGWLIPPEFSLASPVSKTSQGRSKDEAAVIVEGGGPLILEELQRICREEWGPYPKPVGFVNDGGDYVIHFENSSGDRNPSTIVKGEYNKLLLRGHHHFDRSFYLPDGMTAQETIQHLGMRFGVVSTPIVVTIAGPDAFAPKTFLGRYKNSIERAFSRGASLSDPKQLKQEYRQKLGPAISKARTLITNRSRFRENDTARKAGNFIGDYLIVSTEGHGKTTSHFLHLAGEGMDAAVAAFAAGDPTQRFCCIASRSLGQATEKARELSEHPLSGHLVIGVVIQSFWKQYCQVCREVGRNPIPHRQFRGGRLHDIYQQIANDQPDVFPVLEQIRRNLWAEARFDCGQTVICTTHAMILGWHHSRITRTWYHPAFRPLDPSQDHEVLRRQFAISRLLYDEIEIDELIHFVSDHEYRYFQVLQARYTNWRNLSRSEKEGIWDHCKIQPGIVLDFDSFDELMRLDLDALTAVAVDFDAIPFGDSRSPKCIYRRCHGDVYHVGFRAWMFTLDIPIGFLTTEQLPAGLLEALYHRQGQSLLRLDLDNMPGIYPVKLPVVIDPRAKKQTVAELAREIIAKNDNARVIANHCESVENAISFQSMKGVNDLKHNDVYIIPTMLGAAHFSKLNILGQWLGIPDIIEMHYRDLLNQAAGRNQGFRQTGANTTVIAGRRMWKLILSRLNPPKSRIQMYRA